MLFMESSPPSSSPTPLARHEKGVEPWIDRQNYTSTESTVALPYRTDNKQILRWMSTRLGIAALPFS